MTKTKKIKRKIKIQKGDFFILSLVLVCFIHLPFYSKGQVNLWNMVDSEINRQSAGVAIIPYDVYHFLTIGEFSYSFELAGINITPPVTGNSLMITKCNIENQIEWIKVYPSSLEYKIKEIGHDSGSNSYIFGEQKGFLLSGNDTLGFNSFEKQVSLIKINKEGVLQFYKSLQPEGKKEPKVKGFTVSREGDIFMAIELKNDSVFFDDLVFEPLSTESILLLHLNANGNFVKSKIITSPFKIKPEAIYISDLGNLYLAGEFDGRLIFDTSTEVTGGSKQPFIIKTNKDFTFSWVYTQFNGPKKLKVKNMVEDKQGRLIVAGEFERVVVIGPIDSNQRVNSDATKKDILIVKFDIKGVPIWWDHCNPLEEVKPTQLRLDKDDNLYLIGEYKTGFRYGVGNDNPLVTTCTNPQQARGAFLTSYSPQGSLRAAKSISGVNETKVNDIFLDFKNDMYVTGSYKNALAVDTLETIQGGNRDNFFLAKIDFSTCVYIHDYSTEFINKDVVFLHQNFPNPTSGFTYIHFHAAKQVPVSVKIYDLTGREVGEVFNQPQTQVANYVFPFIFPDHCRNGMYLLVLESEEKRLTKKIILER